jgi:hypothetical protein
MPGASPGPTKNPSGFEERPDGRGFFLARPRSEPVNRRALLTGAASAPVPIALAGCLDGTTGDPADGTTPSPTEALDRPRLVDRSFAVERVECGNDYGGHDVVTEDGVVTVEGTLDGSNGCYTAELVAGEYDPDADELYVEVESVENRGDEGCTTCIVEIDCVARFAFEGGEPSRTRVEQRGVSTGSSSASGSASKTIATAVR